MNLGRALAGGSEGVSASGSVFWAFAVVAAGAAGLLPALLPLNATLAVFAAGMVVLTAVALRGALRGGALHAAPEPVGPGHLADAGEEAKAREDRDLRFSRILFYLGTVTVAAAAFRPAMGLTPSEVLFIAAFAGAALTVLRGHSVAPVPPYLLAGVCVFVFGGAISSLQAQSPAGSATELAQGIYVMLLWGWTAAMVLRSRRHVMTALTLWAVSAAASGGGAVAQVFGFEALAGPLEGERATGFADHPNDLGGSTAVALVPALLVATRAPARGLGVRAFRWALVGLIAVGLVLSASVGAMAAGLVAIVVWLSAPAVRAPSRVAVVAAIAASLVVVTLAGGGATSPGERVAEVTSPVSSEAGVGSGQERASTVERAWPRIKEDPLVGTGLDAAGTVVEIISGGRTRPYQAHGAPLAVWYTAGIFGLIGVFVVFGALAMAGLRALAHAESEDDQLIGWALVAAFAAFLVYAMTAPFVFQQYGWLAAVMLGAWWAITWAQGRISPATTTPSSSNGRHALVS